MKPQQKRLLILAGLVFIPFALIRLSPFVFAYYEDGRNEIAILENRYLRYQELLNNPEQWYEQRSAKEAEIAALSDWVFAGNSPSLVGTSLQRELRSVADRAGVNIREMSVAETITLDGWVMVNQKMTFALEQTNILPFLNALDASRPRLLIRDFEVARNRNQFTGSITVTGFNKREEL